MSMTRMIAENPLERNRNYIADTRPGNVVQRSHERRSYDERRKRTSNDSSDDRHSDHSERRHNERGFHPQPRQEIEDDAARQRVLDDRYVQLALPHTKVIIT